MSFCILPESSTNSTILLCLAEVTLIYHCHRPRILDSQGKAICPSFLEPKDQRASSACFQQPVSQENLAKSIRSHQCTFNNSMLPLFYSIFAGASFTTSAVAHIKEPSSPAHSDRGQQHTPWQGTQNKAGPRGHSFRTHTWSLTKCSSGTARAQDGFSV